MKKPICFIGARRGSKGVKRKNIRPLAGKPLIGYTIESAIDSKLFSHIIVSTEDKEIALIAKKFGAEVPFMRPKKLADDNASMFSVWKHGILELQKLEYDFDVMVHRDCTVPFIRNNDIKGTIKLLEQKKCNGVFAVYRQHLNPYFNMVETNQHGFLQISKKKRRSIKRRQDAPIVYQMNGLFAIYVDKLLKYKTHLGPKILPYEIPPETGLMIDTEMEFKLAELLVKIKFFKNL